MQIKHAKPPMLRLFRASILLCLIAMAGCATDEIMQNHFSDEKMIIEEAQLSYKEKFQGIQNFERYFANPLWSEYTITEDSLFNSVVVPFNPLNEKIYAYLMVSVPKDDCEKRIYVLRVFNYEYAKKMAKNPYHPYALHWRNASKTTVEKGYIKNNKWVMTEKISSEKSIFSSISTRNAVALECEDCPIDGGSLDEVIVIGHEPKKKKDGAGSKPPRVYPNPTPRLPNLPQPGGQGFPRLPGGSGNTPPPTTQLSKELKVLFKGKNSLNAEDIEKLNKAFEEMRQKCFYETINNYLSQKNVQLRDIKMNSSYGGQAGINNMGDLTFRDSEQISAENLSHEWIHLFQRAYNNMGTAPFGDKQGMMEFEVALVQDIIKLIDYKGDWDIIAHSWACSNMNNNVYRNKYQDWLDKITIKGTTYPSSIDKNDFAYFAKAFAEVNRTYGYGKKDEDYKDGQLIVPVDYINVKGKYTYVGVDYPTSISLTLYNLVKNCK